MFRNHIADHDRLLEFRSPTYIQPQALIKRRAFDVLPSQNPLIQQQRAHEVAIGIRDARTGNMAAVKFLRAEISEVSRTRFFDY